MSRWEKKFRVEGYKNIAGVDEAGRGPLAGPVVAASCILPKDFLLKDLNDSKKITPKRRKELFEYLLSHSEVFYGIGIVDHQIIDQQNL